MSTDFVQNLIEAIRVRPFLYLKSHPDHRNTSKKTNAWREIQTKLGEEVLYLKSKWKNLKDTYRKHKLSVQAAEAGSGRLSNWVWADRLEFLDCEDPLHFTKDNVDEEERDDSASESEEDVKKPNNVIQIDVPTTTTNRINRSRNSSQVKFVTCKRIQNGRDSDRVQLQNRRKRTHNEMMENSRNESLDDRVNVRNDNKVYVPCDGEDLMFLGYSNSFKKLSHRKQISVKYEFAKILMKAELEDEEYAQKYDAPSPC